MKKRLLSIFALLLLPVLLLAIGFFSSQRLEVERYAFDAGLDATVRVAHLSDLHLPKAGVKKEEILAATETIRPDLIAVTGDLFDGSATEENLAEVEEFLSSLRKLAPVYAVNGNHEIGNPLYEQYRVLCKRIGVELLENRAVERTIGNRTILIAGLKDGSLPNEKNLPLPQEIKNYDLSILLAHRPENFASYAEAGFLYCFCGHAHGGQARFLNRGILSPERELFPPYTSGAYYRNDSTMLVSRGLGDGKSSFRIFNSYHIISATFR